MLLLLRLLLLHLLDVVNGVPNSTRRRRRQIGITLLAASGRILILVTPRLRRPIGIVLEVLRIGSTNSCFYLLIVQIAIALNQETLEMECTQRSETSESREFLSGE